MNPLLTGRHIPTIYDAAQASFHMSIMTVLLSTTQIVTFFACLLYLFTFSFEAVVLPVALILPFSEISVLRHQDKDLGFHRLRARQQAESAFISIQSISHGAFIVPENSRDGDFLVIDVVDTDMFLRIKAMYSI